MTYRAHGTAHGTEFDERGLTEEEATEYASSILDGDVDGTIEIEPEHRTRVVEEATVVARNSIRSVCDCGWYGTPFFADEYADARRDGKAHERETEVPSFDEVEAAGLDGTLRTKATPGPWTRREVDLAREANRRLAEDEFLRRPDGSIYGRRTR